MCCVLTNFDFTVTAGSLGNLDAPLNTQPPRAYSEIFGDIGGRLGQRIIGAEYWLVCQFWLYVRGATGSWLAGGGCRQPGGIRLANHKLCRVGDYRGQPGYFLLGFTFMLNFQIPNQVDNRRAYLCLGWV